jgi:outer membrane protein OmpA-like peptidoglycan-associated protein
MPHHKAVFMRDFLLKSLFRAASLLAIPGLLVASTARAEGEKPEGTLEVGLFGGGHFFAKDGELGVADYPDLVPAIKNSGLLGARLGYALFPRLSLEGELAAIPTSDTFGGQPVFVLGWRAHGLVHLLTSGKWRPFVLAGLGAHSSFTGRTGLTQIENDSDFAFHWGAGLKYDLTPRLSLRGDFRHLLPPSTRGQGVTHDFELHAGLSYRFGGAPAPAVPPPAPQDTDGDGLLDELDKCPSAAEDKDGFQDEDGCPDPDPDPGSDKDNDEDGDGLVGSQDKCPSAAEDKDGFQDEDGCPDPDPDSDNDGDGDGVADAADKCPRDQETRNGFQDDDGCADELPTGVQRFTGVMTGLQFQVGAETIQPSSYKLLDKAVQVLKEHPDVRLEISGHTSAEGDAQQNQELSQRRAEAVKQYLLSKGIEASRLTAQGLGSSRPIAPNDTNAGREKNRRIEFRVINDAPPDGVTAPPKAEPVPGR